MIEKHIVLEDIDPVIFYGVNNVNMKMIQALYPKLKIVARGNVIKVLGDEEEMCAFEENILALEKHCARHYRINIVVVAFKVYPSMICYFSSKWVFSFTIMGSYHH